MLGNNVIREVAKKSIFEDARQQISAATTIKQGSLVCFNETSNLLVLPAAETEGNLFLGVMPVSIVNGKLASPYNTDVQASQSISDVPGPQYGQIHKLTLKTGDSLNPGDNVYLDPATGADGVQAAGTKAIGIYQGKAIAGAAAGTQIEVLVGCRFKDDVLKF